MARVLFLILVTSIVFSACGTNDSGSVVTIAQDDLVECLTGIVVAITQHQHSATVSTNSTSVFRSDRLTLSGDVSKPEFRDPPSGLFDGGPYAPGLEPNDLLARHCERVIDADLAKVLVDEVNGK